MEGDGQVNKSLGFGNGKTLCREGFRLDTGKRFFPCWNIFLGKGHSPEADRAPGVFGQSSLGLGGILGCLGRPRDGT